MTFLSPFLKHPKTNNLGILVDSSLKPTAQIDVAVVKSGGLLAFMKRTFKMLTSHLFIPLYFTIV